MPVDTILKPRRKYVGEEMLQLALQEQHRSFVAVRNHLRKAKKRQADRGTKKVEFKVGDPVYYKNRNQGQDIETRDEHMESQDEDLSGSK